ncbi:MAG: SCO family protein [Rhodocyclaceae bacterium]|nr:SCO family protein [Rhodocyclaceae bacterium]
MPFHRLPVLVALALLAGCGTGDGGGSPAASVAPAPTGGDFVLQSADGPFDTRALRGRVLLVYFGYSHCPDVCPAALGSGAQALNRLDAGERGRVRLVMVSVDPERDTAAMLKEYAAFFHPAMTGVTGTPAEVAAVARAFGAGYVRQPVRPDGGYAVDHSANTYVVGPDGRLAAILAPGATPDQVLAAARKLL